MKRMYLVVGLLALALSLAACAGDNDTTTDAGADPASGACLEGTPDCDDTGILDDYDGEAGADPASGTCLVGTPDCNDTGIIYDGDDAAEQPPSAGMCAPDMPDCVDVVMDDSAGAERCLPEAVDCDDTPGQEEPAGDVFDSEAAIGQAQALLGVTDAELGPDVRIARQGEEWMMLTEDYRIGRLTVELDINDMDEWIVTAVTVELPDAPQTFTRHLQ